MYPELADAQDRPSSLSSSSLSPAMVGIVAAAAAEEEDDDVGLGGGNGGMGGVHMVGTILVFKMYLSRFRCHVACSFSKSSVSSTCMSTFTCTVSSAADAGTGGDVGVDGEGEYVVPVNTYTGWLGKCTMSLGGALGCTINCAVPP